MPPLRKEDWMLPQEAYALRQTRLRGLLAEAAGRWCGYYADSGQAQQPHSKEDARLCCCWVWVGEKKPKHATNAAECEAKRKRKIKQAQYKKKKEEKKQQQDRGTCVS